MKTLQDFAKQSNPPLFRIAPHLPAFFQNNLLDPARVVKYFYNDPQATIRVFYYQYLKLCFQLQEVNYEFYIHKIEQIINNQAFKFMFYEDDDAQIFNDYQFKHLIMEFFGVLGQGGIDIEQALNSYSIMDTVFIYFFRAILILTGKTDALDSYIERDDLLQFLCTYFSVQISVHDKCIKFVETDIFIYEEDPKQVFMAYMDYENYPNSAQNIKNDESSQALNQPSSSNSQNIVPIIPSHTVNHPVSQSSQSQRAASQINQSYIASEFLDYTGLQGDNNLASMVRQDNLKQSGELIQIKNKKNQVQPKPSQSYFNSYSNSSQQIVAPTVTKNTPSQKPVSPEPTYLTNYSQISFQSSINKIAANEIPSYNNISTNTSNTVKPLANFDTPFYKKTEESAYVVKNDWRPTKDPGFESKYSEYTSLLNYQVPAIISSNTNEFYYQSKKPSSKPSYDKQKTQTSNPSYSYNLPLSTNPKPPSNQIQTNMYTKPNANIYSPVYQPFQTPQSKINPTKSAFGLNVSIEFTNSFTMKMMAEPYRTNVYDIRSRARNYRNSLANFVK